MPIDLDLGELRTLVISGPNTGGKTVALKTLGLAALLHQCGLRPPAERRPCRSSTTCSPTSGDRQSIEMNLSTFSGHVRSIVEILDAAGPRSLVLLDELAGGTDPDEGAALAQALVARFAGQARLTVVTTHYAALKEWASGAPGPRMPRPASTSRRTSRSYSLVLGRAGISHALRTAERLGLEPGIVADAASRVDPRRRRTAELLAEAEAAERRVAEQQDRARSIAGCARPSAEAELERELESLRSRASGRGPKRRPRSSASSRGARAELERLREEVRAARRHEGERRQAASRRRARA